MSGMGLEIPVTSLTGTVAVSQGGTGATTAAAAATALGLGTGDSPQFAGIELSHATANTLTGSGGNLLVEGQTVYRVGGTDVAVGDGGTGSSTVDTALTAFGFPAAFVAQLGQRVLRPLPLNTGGNFQTIAAVAYFCYLGQAMRATVIKKVRGLLVTAATVDSVGEVGVFTTTAPPNGGNQALTPTAAFTTTLDDMTAAAPLARGNASDFSTSHAAGVHLWAGINMNTGGNQPIMIGILSDLLTGSVLVKTAAAAFDGVTTYAGVVPVIGTNATPFAPLLQATLD